MINPLTNWPMYKGMINLKHLTMITAISIACMPPNLLYANPTGQSVQSGSATFNQQGNTLNVTNSPGTIINWQDFSIKENETTRFIQQSVDSSVLNRVVGQDPSKILGHLQSNGRVFVINPNGISFGANSIVDVGGLVASTLNLSNEDFLSQNLNFTGDGTNGVINNQGSIKNSEGGFIYLVATDIENHGVITSDKGDVILAAGHSVQLVNSDNPDIRVTLTAPEGEVLNVGEIITQGGKTSIYAGLINQQGVVKADSAIVGENGKIFFKSTYKTTLTSTSGTTANGINGGTVTIQTTEGLTEVSGQVSAIGSNGNGGDVLILGEHVGIIDDANVDASGLTGGGTVLIGGDNKGANENIQNALATFVGVNTQIHADAVNEGDGGKVIVWSDDATRAYGTISALGGSVFGDGGYIETSGGYLDVANIDINLTADNGSGGTWLLDPYDITINTTSAAYSSTGNPVVYTPTGTGSNIAAATLEGQLNVDVSVIVDTTGAGSEDGDITVTSAITKSSGTAATLTLKAHDDIHVNGTISSTFGGTLDIVLTADQDSNGVGAININAGMDANGGNITFTAANDITLNDGATTNIAGATVTLTSTNGSIVGDSAGSPYDILANTIVLNAATGISANAESAPFYIFSDNISFTNSTSGLTRIYSNSSSPTTFSGTSTNGNIILESFYSASASTVNAVTASNGYISFRMNNIDIAGTVNAGSNAVYMKPYTAGTAISVGGSETFDVTDADITNITAGNIFIGEDTFGNYATTADIASLSAQSFGARNVWIRATTGVTFGANDVTVSGGEFYVDNMTTGNISTSNTITADKIQFRSIGQLNIQGGGLVSTGTGDVHLYGEDIYFTGTINAGTNNVYLAPYTSNSPVTINGGADIAGYFSVGQNDIEKITSNLIYIGRNGSTTYASTANIANISAVDVGARNVRIYSNDSVIIGNNNLASTGGYLYFLNDTGTATFTSGTGTISGNYAYINNFSNINIGSGGITNIGTQLLGADVDIAGTITATDVYLYPYNSGTAMSISGSEIFNLTETDLTYINASSNIYIGDATNTTTMDIASIGTVDIGAENLYVRSGNGITVGANSFSAIGGSISLENYNTGEDITTGSGNISSDTITMTSNDWLSVGSGGLTATSNIYLSATDINIAGTVDAGTGNIYLHPYTSGTPISIDGTETFDLSQAELTNLDFGTLTIGRNATTTYASTVSISSSTSTNVGTGSGTAIVRALNDITFGANDFSVVGANMTFVSDSGNVNLGGGTITADTITLNSANNIVDTNGNGANDINATNLTVISGGDASLDYDITGTLTSTGVVGTADLRVYPVTSTTTTTTTTAASTNEPLPTTLDTISSTTNSIATDSTTIGTTTTTAPLSNSDATTESTSTTTEVAEADATTSDNTSDNTSETSDSEEESTTAEEDAQVASSEEDQKTQQLAAAKLPICK